MKALLLLPLLICAIIDNYVVADHTELCALLKDGTQFRRPDTCNEYITCQNQTGQVYSCATPSMYDRNKNTCVETLSDCETNYCAGSNGKWVANPNNCHGFFYCINSVAYPGECPAGYHFSVENQMCVFDTTSDCNMVSNICLFLPDKSKIRNENDCASYYECSGGKKSKKTCKNTYFDIETGQCVEKSHVTCTSHPVPKNVCGTDAKPKKGYRSDDATCRGYYYCKDLSIAADLQPIWYQCPEGTFFDTVTTKCTPPKNAYCIYNRCEGRGTRLVASSRNNCRNYIVCENGREVEERTCSNGKFFDEDNEACVPTIIEYKCCDGKK